MTRVPYYKAYLQEVFAQRKKSNPSYSLRAYARSLGIAAAVLSRTLSNRTSLSLKSAEKLCARLPLTDAERELFLQSVCSEKRRQTQAPASPVSTIGLDTFQLVAELYHYALMELTYVEGFKPDPRWIARALGIRRDEAELAIRRLVRLGLLKLEDRKMLKTSANLTTADKSVTSLAHQQHQRQSLEGALKALVETPLDERAQNSMTLAIDPARLPLAKKMILDVMEQLGDVLESGRRRRVYQLNVSLYPLQKAGSM